MEENFSRTIEPLQEQLKELLKKEGELKKIINQICVFYKEQPLYTDEDYPVLDGEMVFRPDQFFGKGFATAVKELIKMKKRAISAQEILDGLSGGGYDFPEKWKENRLKNLAITLSKNSKDFVQVEKNSGNLYGLWEFYPEKVRERDKKRNNSSDKKNGINEEDDGITGEEISKNENNEDKK